MMRQSNGCSTPVPRFSATKQWIERTGSCDEEEESSACVDLLLSRKYKQVKFSKLHFEGTAMFKTILSLL